MEKEGKSLLSLKFMKVISQQDRLTGKENIQGLKETIMKENGKKENKMDKEKKC